MNCLDMNLQTPVRPEGSRERIALARRINMLCLLLSVHGVWPEAVLQELYESLKNHAACFAEMSAPNGVRCPPRPLALPLLAVFECFSDAASSQSRGCPAHLQSFIVAFKRSMQSNNQAKNFPTHFLKYVAKDPDLQSQVKSVLCFFFFGMRKCAKRPVGFNTFLALDKILHTPDRELCTLVCTHCKQNGDPFFLIVILEYVFAHVEAYAPLDDLFGGKYRDWTVCKRGVFTASDCFRDLLSCTLSTASTDTTPEGVLDTLLKSESVQRTLFNKTYKKLKPLERKTRWALTGSLFTKCMLSFEQKDFSADADLFDADLIARPFSLRSCREWLAECGARGALSYALRKVAPKAAPGEPVPNCLRALRGLYIGKEVSLTPLPRSFFALQKAALRAHGRRTDLVLCCVACKHIKNFYVSSGKERTAASYGYVGVARDDDVGRCGPLSLREILPRLMCQRKRPQHQSLTCHNKCLTVFQLVDERRSYALTFFGKCLLVSPCCGLLCEVTSLVFTPDGVKCKECTYNAKKVAEAPVALNCAYCDRSLSGNSTRRLQLAGSSVHLCKKHYRYSFEGRFDTLEELVRAVRENTYASMRKAPKRK